MFHFFDTTLAPQLQPFFGTLYGESCVGSGSPSESNSRVLRVIPLMQYARVQVQYNILATSSTALTPPATGS